MVQVRKVAVWKFSIEEAGVQYAVKNGTCAMQKWCAIWWVTQVLSELIGTADTDQGKVVCDLEMYSVKEMRRILLSVHTKITVTAHSQKLQQ